MVAGQKLWRLSSDCRRATCDNERIRRSFKYQTVRRQLGVASISAAGLRLLCFLRRTSWQIEGERMRTTQNGLLIVALLFFGMLAGGEADDSKTEVKEKQFTGPSGLAITVRMQGPYDADVPLQIVCYFKHRAEGDKTSGAPVELDKRLGGAIAALRNRGEFVGDELETLLLTPPEGTIKPKLLLLVGLGDEESLSLDRIER